MVNAIKSFYTISTKITLQQS